MGFEVCRGTRFCPFLIFVIVFLIFPKRIKNHQSIFNKISNKKQATILQPVFYLFHIVFFKNYFFIIFLISSPRTSSYISNLALSLKIEFVPSTSIIWGCAAIFLFILIDLVDTALPVI